MRSPSGQLLHVVLYSLTEALSVRFPEPVSFLNCGVVYLEHCIHIIYPLPILIFFFFEIRIVGGIFRRSLVEIHEPQIP